MEYGTTNERGTSGAIISSFRGMEGVAATNKSPGEKEEKTETDLKMRSKLPHLDELANTRMKSHGSTGDPKRLQLQKHQNLLFLTPNRKRVLEMIMIVTLRFSPLQPMTQPVSLMRPTLPLTTVTMTNRKDITIASQRSMEMRFLMRILEEGMQHQHPLKSP